MQITKRTIDVLPFLRAGGLNHYVRGWDRILRTIFPLEEQSYEIVNATYRGRPYAASPRHYVDWQVLTTGAYERDDLCALERLIRDMDRPVILDIGANVGHHSFFFASLGADVHAFEPNPTLWPFIEAKMAAARFTNVSLHKFGLASDDRTLSFHVPDSANSGTGHFMTEPRFPSAEVNTLPVRNGDDFLSRHGISKVDLVKIDVQGFESEVLRGLSECLNKKRPIVCVEIGSENRIAIPTLESLRSLLPPDYSFLMFDYSHIGPLRIGNFDQLQSDRFGAWEGNLFCLPLEKRSQDASRK
jgi:FkbM family methyltransferase